MLSISVIFVYPGNMIYSDWTDPLTLSLCLMTLPFFNSSIAASPMEGNPWPHQVLLFLGITPVWGRQNSGSRWFFRVLYTVTHPSTSVALTVSGFTKILQFIDDSFILHCMFASGLLWWTLCNVKFSTPCREPGLGIVCFLGDWRYDSFVLVFEEKFPKLNGLSVPQ